MRMYLCTYARVCTFVFANLYVCACIYNTLSAMPIAPGNTYVHMYPYVYTYIHMFLCACVCVSGVFLYIHRLRSVNSTISFTTCPNAYVHIYLSVYTYTRVCVCVCVCACMNVCTYIGCKTSAVRSDIPLAPGNTWTCIFKRVYIHTYKRMIVCACVYKYIYRLQSVSSAISNTTCTRNFSQTNIRVHIYSNVYIHIHTYTCLSMRACVRVCLYMCRLQSVSSAISYTARTRKCRLRLSCATRNLCLAFRYGYIWICIYIYT